MGVGTAFEPCVTCRTQVEVGTPECPQCGNDPRVKAPASPRAGAVLAVERFDEHTFPADPRELAVCIDCGRPLAEASLTRCGPR